MTDQQAAVDDMDTGRAPEALEADEGRASTPRRRPRLGRVIDEDPRLTALVGGLAALSLILAGALVYVLAAWWAPLHVEALERDEVREVARELALRLTTYDGERIEEWVPPLRELATDDFERELTAALGQDLRDSLREAEARSVGELVDLFVQDIDEDEASAFAVVRQTIANVHLEDPVEDEVRMDITLRRVEGEWKVSDVAVLPSISVGGTDQAPGPVSPPPPVDEED